MQNLFAHLPQTSLPKELLEELINGREFKVVRIVSTGHTAPASGWYNQDMHEWVILLQGAATISFDDGREAKLSPGDYLMIPAHCKHRVSWTQPDAPTVWLAIYYRPLQCHNTSSY